MATPAQCIITGFIPHGNTMAELHDAVRDQNVLSGGMPKIIPLYTETDDRFADWWHSQMDRALQVVGIPGILSFPEILDGSSGIQELRRRIPSERTIAFTPVPRDIAMRKLLAEPVRQGNCMLLWGWHQTEKKSPSSGKTGKGDSITVKTFQLAKMQLELSDTGLLTWRTLESCWAPRN